MAFRATPLPVRARALRSAAPARPRPTRDPERGSCARACRHCVPASRSAVSSLEYAAEKGMPGAMWKLGRMYADGEGVGQNKLAGGSNTSST